MCRYLTSRDGGDIIVLVHGDEQNPEERLGAYVNADKESITYFWRSAGPAPVAILQAIADEYGCEIFPSLPELHGENPLYEPRVGDAAALKDQTPSAAEFQFQISISLPVSVQAADEEAAKKII
jgi:hypothetical protein